MEVNQRSPTRRAPSVTTPLELFAADDLARRRLDDHHLRPEVSPRRTTRRWGDDQMPFGGTHCGRGARAAPAAGAMPGEPDEAKPSVDAAADRCELLVGGDRDDVGRRAADVQSGRSDWLQRRRREKPSGACRRPPPTRRRARERAAPPLPCRRARRRGAEPVSRRLMRCVHRDPVEGSRIGSLDLCSSSAFLSSARARWAAASRRLSPLRDAGFAPRRRPRRDRAGAGGDAQEPREACREGRRRSGEVLERVTPVDALVPADLLIEAIVEDAPEEGDLPPRRRGTPGARSSPRTRRRSRSPRSPRHRRPDRVIGMHFFNPVPVMQLVEVIRAVQTSDETAAATSRSRGPRKVPAQANDFPASSRTGS